MSVTIFRNMYICPMKHCENCKKPNTYTAYLGLNKFLCFWEPSVPKKPCIPKNFIGSSKIFVQFLVCFQSITGKKCLHQICYAAVSLFQFSWVLLSVSICF